MTMPVAKSAPRHGPSYISWNVPTLCQRGQVQVVIGKSVLKRLRKAGDKGSRNIFQKNRERLEYIASRKFDREGANAIGNVNITIDDVNGE